MEKNNLNGIVIRDAREQDLESIQRLLRESGLPADDVAEHQKTFLVALSDDRLVGTVGIEVTGSAGLLRSLAVAEELRGKGLGMILYHELIKKARSLGIRELGLLTTTAEGFFSRVGFRRETRSPLPAFIALSKEYKIFCPSTAVIMTKTLS